MEIVQDFRYNQGPKVTKYIQGLKIAVAKYAMQASCVYIGITGDIDQRMQKHVNRSKKTENVLQSKNGWSRMIAIYNTTNADDAKDAEKLLIRFLRSSPIHAHKCLNKSMGGELNDLYKHYYIYILLGPAYVRRAYWG